MLEAFYAAKRLQSRHLLALYCGKQVAYVQRIAPVREFGQRTVQACECVLLMVQAHEYVLLMVQARECALLVVWKQLYVLWRMLDRLRVLQYGCEPCARHSARMACLGQ